MLNTSVNPASVCDHGILNDCVGADLVTGHTAVTAVDLPVFIKDVDSAVFRIEDFHICFPEGGDCSNVLPVSRKVVRVHLPPVF